MLVRDDDLRRLDRLAIFVTHRHLALGVRAELRRRPLAGFAGVRQVLENFVGVEHRRRHQRRGLVGGVAEHDALVAGALFLVVAGLQRVHALRDVGGLRMQQDVDLRLLPMEAFLLVADVLHRQARDMGDPVLGDVARPAGLAGDDDPVGGGERLAGGADSPGVEAGRRALAEEQVHDFVGNAVADLVGMPFRHRLAREMIILPRHPLSLQLPARMASAARAKSARFWQRRRPGSS